jgi:anti-sigma B factor antagonist
MDLDISIEKDKVRIAVSGAIDTQGGSELTAKFMEIVKDEGIFHASFDLREVPSVTSAGIGKLLAFFKHFDKKGGTMKIEGVSDSLRRQFSEIHLDQIIPIS